MFDNHYNTRSVTNILFEKYTTYIYIFELSYTKQIIVVVENQWPKMADYDGKFQVKSCGYFSGGIVAALRKFSR